MNDEAAILLAREGDEDAFRSLYDHHRERIYRIAFRYTQSVHDAEDILQETFVRAFRRIGTFRPQNEASFGAWLASICINRSIDHMRQKRRRKMDATVTLADAADAFDAGGRGGGAGGFLPFGRRAGASGRWPRRHW